MVRDEEHQDGSTERPTIPPCSAERVGSQSEKCDITQILSAIEQGDGQSANELLPLVYDELRRLAARKMAQEKSGHTLQPTALVHEVYIRLVDVEQSQHWNSRHHFFTAAASAMRRILVDAARRKQGPRHGGGMKRQNVDVNLLGQKDDSQQVLQIHEALHGLAEEDPPVAALVELRYFGGLSLADAAKTLGVSIRTASRYWAYAKIWLHHELHGVESSES